MIANDPHGEVLNFVIGAGTSVILGGIIRGATGGDIFDPAAIAADAALGAVGAGVVSKINQARNLSRLNSLPTVTQNQVIGNAAEQIAVKQISSSGNNLVRQQISVKTTEGVRRLDNLVQTPGGQFLNIEVKSGNATRNAAQIAKDALIASPISATTFIGNKAGALRNTLTGPIATQELNISRSAAQNLATRPNSLVSGTVGGAGGAATSHGANGGFLIYPNKLNTNFATRVYSK